MMLRLHMVDCDDLGDCDDFSLILVNSDHIVFIVDYLDHRFIALDSAGGVLNKLQSFDVKETLGEIENMINRKVY